MPELPDVEIFRRYLESTALHKEIETVNRVSGELLAGISPKRLEQSLTGNCFRSTDRHGKYLFVQVEGEGCLILHFGMSGFLKYFKNKDQAPEHIRLLLTFSNGFHLAYDCRRKLGRITWKKDPGQFIAEQELGPDALAEELDEDTFRSLLQNRRGSIKSLLMNQHSLAGIGNIYSDEILYQAGIHPKRHAADLQSAEQKQLYNCLRRILQAAIDCRVGENGWPEGWLLSARKPGQSCPRCSGKIQRLEVAGRNAYFCENHQSLKSS